MAVSRQITVGYDKEIIAPDLDTAIADVRAAVGEAITGLVYPFDDWALAPGMDLVADRIVLSSAKEL